jgi:DNA-binding response OmpR family regulator
MYHDDDCSSRKKRGFLVISETTVLFVDDEPVLRDVSKQFLERENDLSVDTCASAKEALAALKIKKYDVIVSDYEMPVMNGINFLKMLREAGDTTPFIIFSGRGREEVVIEALNNGADFYIQKGGDPKAQFVELKNQIHHITRRKRAEAALLQSEARYRLITDNMSDSVWLMDKKFRLTFISPSVERRRVPAEGWFHVLGGDHAVPDPGRGWEAIWLCRDGPGHHGAQESGREDSRVTP